MNLLLVDNPCNSKDYKYKLAEILFEEMKIGSLLFFNSATLSLFATGSQTGLVVESGHGITNVTPVFEGFPLPHAGQFSTIAGKEITNQL